MSTKNIRWVIVLAAVILIVLGVIYWQGNKVSTSLSGDQGSIKIGVIIPLTGNYASIGTKIKNGLELAKEDWESKNPNQKIELIYEDQGNCLPADTVSATQKLINVDKVRVIGAQFCVPGLVPSLAITEPNKVVTAGIAASVQEVLKSNYYFSPSFSVKDNSINIADFAVNKLHAKRAAFLYYETQLGKNYRTYTGKRFEELGGQIVADEMTPLSQTNFRANLTKIKAAKPDVIFVTQITGALGNVLKEAKEMNIEVRMIGNNSNEDSVMLGVAGKAAEGFIISSADPASIGENPNGFLERFKAKFGVDADYFSSNAYDALSLEIPAYLKSNGDTDKMMTELHKIVNYAGASGKITINKEGIASKPVLFKVVKDGKFVTVQ